MGLGREGRYGGAAYRGPYSAGVRTPSGAAAVRGPAGNVAVRGPTYGYGAYGYHGRPTYYGGYPAGAAAAGVAVGAAAGAAVAASRPPYPLSLLSAAILHAVLPIEARFVPET